MGWKRSKRYLLLTCLMSALLSACPKNEVAVTQANDSTTRAAMMAGVKIKTHPTDQLFSEQVTFSVEATSIDGSPLRYQWQISTDNGATYSDVSGENESSIVLEGLTADAVGRRYRAQVSTLKSGKKISSNSAEIKPGAETTSASVDFERHPEDQQTTNGDASFSVKVVATDVPDLSYQWQVSLNSGLSFSDISGAQADTLSLHNMTSISNGNRYRVKVSSSQKDILKYSDDATLKVMSAVSIQTQPQSITTSTQTASFNISATASLGDTVRYQWLRSTDGGASFLDIPGENGVSITLNGLTVTNNGDRYMVRVEAGLGNTMPIYSESATLSVSPTISIGTQPSNVTSTNGSATFSVSATSSLGSLSYQWQKSTDGGTTFTDLSGKTTSSLSLTGLTLPDHTAKFRVRLSINGASSQALSNAAVLYIKPAISISQHPASQTVSSLSASFSVVATATLGGTLSYQWQKSTDGGSTYSDIPSSTQATLTLSGLAPTTQVIRYLVKITAGGLSDTLTSNAANLTIQFTGSHNGSFYVNNNLIPTLDSNGYGDYNTVHYSAYPSQYEGFDPNTNLTYQNGKPLHGVSGGFCYTNGTKGNALNDPYLGVTGYCNDLYYYQGALANGMIAASTSLLMHMNGNLDDSSFIPKGISSNGSVNTANAESPFTTNEIPNSSLEVPSYGNMSALSITAGPHFDFGTGDWTIEFWIKSIGSPEHCARVFQTTDGDILTGLAIGSNNCDYSTNLGINFWNGVDSGWTTGMSIGYYDANGWTHFAVARSGNYITSFANGYQSNSIYYNGQLAPSSGNAVIGGNAYVSGSRSINAYIDELRIVKGVALYSSSFSPPTTELTNIGLPYPKCFDQGAEVSGIDTAGTGLCLNKYYVAGVLSAGNYQGITYDSNGDPLNGLEFPDGRYFVNGQPAQGYYMAYDSRYMYSQSGYFISGWYANSMMSGGVDSNGHGRWCTDKLTGSYQCNNYVSGEVFNDGYSSVRGIYFMDSFATTLDSTGTGSWYDYTNWETLSYWGQYVGGIKDFSGWHPETNMYYIMGYAQSGVNSSGNGYGCNNATAMCHYYISGTTTTLDSSGNGNWCGTDWRYSMDAAYNGSPSSGGATCHNYQNGDIIMGCFNSNALNYNSNATYDDGTCLFGFDGSGNNWNPWVYRGPTEVTSCAQIRLITSINPSSITWSNSSGSGQDGVYQIKVASVSHNVYCDMTTDGGGWTLMASAVGGSVPDTSWTTSTDGVNVGNSTDLNQTSRLPDYLINSLKGITGRYTKNMGSTAVFFNTSVLWFTSNTTSTVGTVCSDPELTQSCRELNYSDQNTGAWGIYDNASGNGWDGSYTAILQPADTATECGPDPRFGVTGYQCDNSWPSAGTYLYLWGR